MNNRTRDWRRAQNKKVVEKRLNIIKNCWRTTVSFSMTEQPGRLKKNNLTCDCGMCSNWIEKGENAFNRFLQKEAKSETMDNNFI